MESMPPFPLPLAPIQESDWIIALDRNTTCVCRCDLSTPAT